jgi:hypothetical protein
MTQLITALAGRLRADEFLMVIVPHVAARHRAAEHIEGRKQGSRAMPLASCIMVVGRPGSA